MTDVEKIDEALVTLYALKSYLNGESDFRRQQFGASGGRSPLLDSIDTSIERLHEVKKSLETDD